MKLAPERLVFPEQPPQANQPVDTGGQILEEDRLHQVVVGSALKGGDGVFHRRIGGDHDEQGLGAKLKRPVQNGDPVSPGKLNVAEDDLGLECFDLGQSRGKVSRHGHLESLALEKLLEVAAMTSSSSTIKMRPRGAAGSADYAAASWLAWSSSIPICHSLGGPQSPP